MAMGGVRLLLAMDGARGGDRALELDAGLA